MDDTVMTPETKLLLDELSKKMNICSSEYILGDADIRLETLLVSEFKRLSDISSSKYKISNILYNEDTKVMTFEVKIL